MRDNRATHAIRPLTLQRSFTKHALGSVLIAYGDTKVLCTACIEEKVPPFMRGLQKGWLTAEYSLLPGATHTRSSREAAKGKQTGRTQEIQRLIGRSLRSILDFSALGERTIQIDADVLQADGGTRTAAITGSMVALHDAVSVLLHNGMIQTNPIKEWLAAVSVGICDQQVRCDLDYDEDVQASVDMNLVMTESGRFIEIQGTAEGDPFDSHQLQELLRVGREGIIDILGIVKAQLG